MESPVSSSPLLEDHRSAGKTSATVNIDRKSLYEDTTFMVFAKRIFVNANMLAMCANTLGSITTIAADVSLIDVGYDSYQYNFCTYGRNGNPTGLQAQCPYDTSPGFVAILTLWSLYYASFFVASNIFTRFYDTNDLRFFIAAEHYKALMLNKVMIGVGIVLTVLSVGVGLFFVMHNGSDSSVGSILVFGSVNIYNLVMMANCQFEVLSGQGASTDNLARLFPTPVYINTYSLAKPGNGYGLFLSNRALFTGISDAIYASIVERDETYLIDIGDPSELKLCAQKLNPYTRHTAGLAPV